MHPKHDLLLREKGLSRAGRLADADDGTRGAAIATAFRASPKSSLSGRLVVDLIFGEPFSGR
jgi:hypothetical protein